MPENDKSMESLLKKRAKSVTTGPYTSLLKGIDPDELIIEEGWNKQYPNRLKNFDVDPGFSVVPPGLGVPQTNDPGFYKRPEYVGGKALSDRGFSQDPQGLGIYVNPLLQRTSATTMVPGYSTIDMIAPGNIDIHNRPMVWNPQEQGWSNVFSMGIEEDGKHIVIPRVSEDGRILTPDEAYALWRKTGRHLGMFKSRLASDMYAGSLHRYMAARGGMGRSDTEPMPSH